MVSHQCLSTDYMTTSHNFGKQSPSGAGKAWEVVEYMRSMEQPGETWTEGTEQEKDAHQWAEEAACKRPLKYQPTKCQMST